MPEVLTYRVTAVTGRRFVMRHWLEALAAILVAVGVWLLVSRADDVGTLDLTLAVGTLGTLLLTAGGLALSRRQAEGLNRPYIGTVAAESQDWDNATLKGWAVFRIQNSDKIPGRITSDLTQTGGQIPMPQTHTRGDMLFPGDSINTGWAVCFGDTVVKTLDYERVDGRGGYSYRVEYLVERTDSGAVILSIVNRSGS